MVVVTFTGGTLPMLKKAIQVPDIKQGHGNSEDTKICYFDAY